MDPINETRTYQAPSGPPLPAGAVDDDFVAWIKEGGPKRGETRAAVAEAMEALRALKASRDSDDRAAQSRQQSRDDGDDATRSRTR